MKKNSRSPRLLIVSLQSKDFCLNCKNVNDQEYLTADMKDNDFCQAKFELLGLVLGYCRNI